MDWLLKGVGTRREVGRLFIMLTGGGVLDFFSGNISRTKSGLGRDGEGRSKDELEPFIAFIVDTFRFQLRSMDAVMLIVLLVPPEVGEKKVSRSSAIAMKAAS